LLSVLSGVGCGGEAGRAGAEGLGHAG